MKAEIEVALTPQQLTAQVVGSTVRYVGPNRVALVEANGHQEIAAIGNDADSVPDATVVHLSADDSFDPAITAGVVGYLGLLMWDRLHPGIRGPLSLIGHADVRVAIEAYATIDERRRAAFLKALPYRPNITWWVNGERVRD